MLLWMWVSLSIVIVGTVVWLLNKPRLPGLVVTGVMCVAVLVSGGILAAGMYSNALDREILNGEVTGKERNHGHYTRSYSCNCRSSTNSKGQTTTTCDTCYEDRYTVEWRVLTNIEPIILAHEDKGYKAVYNLPDPARYSSVKNGDPVAVEHTFINYIKASPDSLYYTDAALADQYKDIIPQYPGNVFDYYRINRALAVNVSVPDLDQWNNDISVILTKLGPSKQVNIVVMFTNVTDPAFAKAVEAAWLNGKKNDVIVIIGTSSYPTIDWVRILSWTPNELYKIKLRDELFEIGTIDRTKMIGIIKDSTAAGFERARMRDFEYLTESIHPPVWVVVLAGTVGLIIVIGMLYYIRRNTLNHGTKGKYK